MMKKKLLLLPLIALGLAGCHRDTPDGKVPHEYVGQAQQYQGQFQGQFDGKPTEMGLWMDGDRPYVVVQNQQNDLIGQECGSTVGQLQGVDVEQDDGQQYLEGAQFQFDGGQCQGQVEQEIEFEFSQDTNQFQATVQSADKSKRHTGRFYRRY